MNMLISSINSSASWLVFCCSTQPHLVSTSLHHRATGFIGNESLSMKNLKWQHVASLISCPVLLRSVPLWLQCFPHRWNKLDFFPPCSTRSIPLCLPLSLCFPASDPESVLHPEPMVQVADKIKGNLMNVGLYRISLSWRIERKKQECVESLSPERRALKSFFVAHLHPKAFTQPAAFPLF